MNKNNKKNGSRVLQGLLLATTAITGSTVIAATAAMAAGPTGGSVVVGSATITNPSATQTTITQSSKKALINWNSFSISKGSTVTFNQPSSKSLTVNRVTGPNASAIDGQLLANGSVWLINANGILFGKGSEINVGALIATTSDISDGDFKNGKYNFSKPSSNPDASVTNLGTITTSSGGSVVLSAPSVSNQGLIQANLGTVVLGGASAFTVDMTGDNLLRYQISAPVAQAPKDANGNPQSALVSNAGTIVANGGQVVMTARAAQSVQDDVINNTGMVQATSVSSHNGEIDLDAGTNGTVNASGTLDVSGTGTGQTGGTVTITGQNVNVADGAKINASGDVGGGTVEIGGGLHGQGAIANAQNTTVGNATITADAVTKGNGGTVSVWSSGNTSFNGAISSRGGAQGGNGGLVETSGSNLGVGSNATVDTTAPLGLTGDWLLDPSYVDICTGNSQCTIDPATINSNLGSSNVTLEADSQIDVNGAISWSSGNALSLISGGNINVLSSIQNSGSGDINLVTGWNSSNVTIAQISNATATPGTDGIPALFEGTADSYGASGGSVSFGNSSGLNANAGSLHGAVTVLTDNLTLTTGSSGATEQLGHIGTGGGAINIFATGGVTLDASTGGSAQIGNGSTSTSGATTGDINIQVVNALSLKSAGGNQAWIGNRSVTSETGNVAIVFGSETETNGTTLGQIIYGDIGETAGQGGNVTIARTDGNALQINTSLDVLSTHNLTVLSKGDIDITSSVENDGSGNITLVAGWDGVSIAPASIGAAGTYGQGSVPGSVNITATTAAGNVFLGSESGDTTVYGYDVNVDAENGFAQLGFHGATSGEIDVNALDNVSVSVSADAASNAIAQIGNGGSNVFGAVGGNINVTAQNAVDLTASGTTSRTVIGNISNGNTPNPASQRGTITVTANGGGTAIDINAAGDGSRAQIGNFGFGPGGDASGNINVDATSGDITIESNGADTARATMGNGASANTSAEGDITVYADDIMIVSDVDSGLARIGSIATGDVDSSISIYATNGGDGSISLTANDAASGAIIGNGTSGDASGTIDVEANGNVALQAEGNTSQARIGQAGIGVSGNVTVTADGSIKIYADGDNSVAFVSNFANPDNSGNTDPVSGNISVESTVSDVDIEANGVDSLARVGLQNNGTTSTVSGTVTVTSDYDYDGADYYSDINLEANGDGSVAQIGNSGGSQASITGDVTVSGAYVNVSTGHPAEDCDCNQNEAAYPDSATAQIGNGGAYSTGNIGGTVTVAADQGIYVDVEGPHDIVQIGNGGYQSNATTSGGVTLISANGDIWVTTEESGYIQIGNGGYQSNGSASGNIDVEALNGSINVDTYAPSEDSPDYNQPADSFIQIGNGGDSSNLDPSAGFSDTGNITLKAGSIDLDVDDAVSGIQIGNGGDCAGAVSAGCGSSGDYEGTEGSVSFDGTITIQANSLSLSAELNNSSASIGNGGLNSGQDLDISDGSLSTSGSIGVTLGDDDHPGSLTMETDGTGHNEVRIGNGGDSADDGAVADDGVTIGGDITVTINGGDDDGGSADIDTYASGNSFAQIGNEGDSSGSAAVSGTINVNVDGYISLDNDGTDSNYAIIGNVGSSFPTENDVTITAQSIDGVGQSVANDIPNGDVTVAVWGDDGIDISDQNDFSSSYDLTLLSAGDITIGGTLRNLQPTGGGAITLVAGWDGSTTDPATLTAINGGAYGNNGGSVIVGGETGSSNGSEVADASGTLTVEGYDVTVEADNAKAQIGYSGAATDSITVNATDNVELYGGDSSGFYAQIGNGAADGSSEGDVSGDINVTATNNIGANDGEGVAWIGNNTDTSENATSGNVTLIGADVSLDEHNLASDLGNGDENDNGGDVFIGYTNGSGSSFATAFDGVTYDSGNSLTLATTGDLDIESDVQNSGAGDITLVGGWDGSTTDVSAILANANNHEYGNGATITIGGSTDPSVGSAGGTTTIVSDNLTLDATGGDAQIGYSDAGGDIDIALTGALSLIGDTSDDDEHYTAQIGNGDYGSNPGGDVTITADSISNTANSDVTGDNVAIDITGSSNGIGTSGQYLDVAVNNLAITTQGGDAYINSPNLGFNIGVESVGGVELNGGALYLSATGNITQSDSIDANSINVTTVSSGDITLTNADNTFGFATISSAGSASITDAVSLNIESAYVSDTLTLDVDGDITQGSGAISATTLIATATTTSSPATSGSITLDNSANTISYATLSASGDATLDDSSALEIDGARVGSGNTLTLYDTASGGITQGGTADDAITATNLVATAASGPITLGNTGNSIGNATFTAGGNVTLYDTAALTIQKATLAGYTLTLTDTNAGGIGQASGGSNAITASSINVTDNSGAITFDNMSNSVGAVTFSAGGDVVFDDGVSFEVDGAKLGGYTLTLDPVISVAITQGAESSDAIIADAIIATNASGSITLDNTSNSVGAVTFSAGGNVTFDDGIGFEVDDASLAGHTLTLVAVNGDVSQGTLTSDAISASNLNVTAQSGAVTLTNMSNSFGALTLSASGDGSIYDTAALTIDGASVGSSKTLTITDTNSGGIGQGAGSGNKITASNLVITDSSGAITLNNMSNAIGTLVLTANGSSTVDDSVALKILGATVGTSNALTLYETNGNITQGAASTNAINASVLNVTDTSGAVILDNANNVVGTLALSATGDSTFDDTTALQLNGINISGGHGITVHAGGNINESAGGSTAITAGSLIATTTSGAITLTNGSNAVGAASFTATGDVSFTDSIGFILNGASLAGQTLTLTDTGGDITQGSASSNAIAAHTLYLTDTSGGITLDNTHNSFSTVTLSANGDSTLYDTNSGGLYIQTADVGDSSLTLTATRGDITQNTAASYAITAGAVNATASNGSITLGNDSNQIGAVTFMAANDATLHDASAVEIDGATVGDSNTLTLYDTSEGGISQGGGDDDGISAPTLVATATNGGIILDNSGNSVSDATFTASGDVTLADTTGLTLNGASLSGYTLTLDDTGGDIDQGTDASDAIVASTLNASSTNGNVTLTNTGNTVDSASFTAGGDADFYDTSALEIDGASVDGTLTLTVAEGDITQGSGGSSGIMAGAVNATATSGAVTLDSDNNSIGAVTFSASTDATLHDASSVEIDGVSVGDANTFTIADTGGNITQGSGSGNAISAPTLSASATNGFVNLNNADNAVSDASLSSAGNSTLYDSQDLAITGISVGGNLTLLTTGNLTFESSAQLSDGDLLAVAGWDGTTTSRTSIIGNGAYGNNSGSVTIGGDNADDDVAVGSASGTTTLAGDTVTLDAENGYAQLGYHGAGGGDIYAHAKGDIVVQATDGSNYALIGNGTLGDDVSGNETGNIYLLAAGDIQLNTNGDSDEPATPWIGNSFGSSGVASGNLTIVAQDEEENCGTDDCDYGIGLMVMAALGSTSLPGSGGDVVVAYTNPENNDSPVMTITDSFNYNSPHNLTVISGNSLYVDNSIQNAGSGNITLISGWNSGVVTGQNIIGAVHNNTPVSSLFSSKSSYGQTNNGDTNNGSIEIGCDAGDATCSSNTAAVGSASGTVTVFTNNLELTAGAGLGAQLGYIGAGSGAINVNAQGNVALTGGSVTGSYAQIGDGGYRIKGDTSDNITVNAGGIVQLEGGTVQESYAQIGNGGAESNHDITGQYSDTGIITVTGQSVVMQAGTGSASYVQIGNGGYKAGENLNGTATIGGPISVTVSPPSNTAGVALTGGSADAYAQIGNGGDQVNYLWSGTGGTISGDISVKVSPAQSNSDAIQMVGGTSNNGYAQIGNGGNGENTPASGTSVGFKVSGSITVVDLKLWGGNGTNDYGQIGNGDNAGTGYGNVEGGIAIGGTDFNFKNGNGSGDTAGIGNNTGFGTITNNITGYPPPNTGPGAGAQGAISSTTQIPTIPTGFDITTVTITPGPGSSPSNDNGSGGATPLEQIADGNGEGSQDSDSAADALGNSLNGHKVSSVTHIIIPGVLTQIVTLGSHNPNGVPPADADYSSWGNEALWRW